MMRPALAPFGHPGSVAAERLHNLPPVMQTEGLRLLFEMGQTARQISERTCFSLGEIELLLATRHLPFKRDGEGSYPGGFA